MAKTLVGAFDDKTAAKNAVRDLKAEGVGDSHVRLMANDDAAPAAGSSAGAPQQPWTEKVSNWFSSLFEDESDKVHSHDYAEAWRRGHYLVVADVDASMVDRAVAILNRYGTVDMTARAQQWKKTGYTGTFDPAAKPYTADERAKEMASYRTDATAQRPAGQDATIPVVQEEVAIGKRVVQRNGVRVHSYVTERPVDEVVRLREEKINVMRRPVDRPATAGDMAFNERTVEVTAMKEEAVVQKRARVIEEVSVGKQVEQRDQAVHETVRRKDVAVEQVVPTDGTTPRTTTPGMAPRR